MGLYNAILALCLIGTLFLGRLDAFRAQTLLLSLHYCGRTVRDADDRIAEDRDRAVAAGGPGARGRCPRSAGHVDRGAGGRANHRDRTKAAGRSRRRPGKTRTKTMFRGQHPKSVGFVVADFVVETGLPEDLRFGVFKERGARYGAVVRFSNARNLGDAKTGGHGMAIKLFGVQGEKLMPTASETQTQDFLLFRQPRLLRPRRLRLPRLRNRRTLGDGG